MCLRGPSWVAVAGGLLEADLSIKIMQRSQQKVSPSCCQKKRHGALCVAATWRFSCQHCLATRSANRFYLEMTL